MTEDDFWKALEFRITSEMRRSGDNHLRFLWCDGLIPSGFRRLKNESCIRGLAWIGDERSQEEWHFTLLLRGINRPASHAKETLLPDDSDEEWLRVDLQAHEIEVDCRSRRSPE